MTTSSVCARNLHNHQKQLLLQWILMLLHIRTTWFLMIFTIYFVTCFGIAFRWIWASFQNNIFSQSFCLWFVGLNVYWFLAKREPSLVPFVITFSTLFPRGFFGTSLGSLWHPIGSIFLFSVPFRLHFGSPSLMCFHVFLTADLLMIVR